MVSKDRITVASKLKLFQSDDLLISGFFSSISSFNESILEGENGEVKSINGMVSNLYLEITL